MWVKVCPSSLQTGVDTLDTCTCLLQFLMSAVVVSDYSGVFSVQVLCGSYKVFLVVGSL